MRRVFVIAALFCAQVTGMNSQPPTSGLMEHFIKAVGAILDAAPELWSKIAKFQAEASIQTVISDLTSAEAKKDKLRSDILDGRIQSCDELSRRLKEVLIVAQQSDNTLYKFANEIDSSSKNIAGDMRAAALRNLSTKMYWLEEVQYDWVPGKSAAAEIVAASDIDRALGCEEEIRASTSCLVNTITNGVRDPRPECSTDSIAKQRSSCTREEKNYKDAYESHPRPIPRLNGNCSGLPKH